MEIKQIEQAMVGIKMVQTVGEGLKLYPDGFGNIKLLLVQTARKYDNVEVKLSYSDKELDSIDIEFYQEMDNTLTFGFMRFVNDEAFKEMKKILSDSIDIFNF